MQEMTEMNPSTPLFPVSNPPPFDVVGLVTFLRTYARRKIAADPDSPLETWQETLSRIVHACNTQLGVGFTPEESQEFFDLLYNLKGSVAGRFLWQLGTTTVDKLGLMSLQNCAFTVVDQPIEPFTWVMNFLMLGAGCGYRILPTDVSKLPCVKRVDIRRWDVKDADFIVPDTREGWCKLLGKLLKAHFYSGKGFTYSTHELRSKGAPIKGFGGLSSGPEILCEGIKLIHALLNKRAGQKITTVDALDMMNIIGKVVVSGNVRRSAQIAIGDATDTEFMRAKRWDLGQVPNYRCYSNNSAQCSNIEDVLSNDEFWEGYNGNGEPYGLINLDLSRSCGRLGETQYSDRHVEGYNPCVTSDTWIATEDGPRQVIDLLGRTIRVVVDGRLYSTTSAGFFATGTRKVLRLCTREGYSLKLTGNHLVQKWQRTLNLGFPLARGEWTWVEAKTLVPGDYVRMHDHSKRLRESRPLPSGMFLLEDARCEQIQQSYMGKRVVISETAGKAMYTLSSPVTTTGYAIVSSLEELGEEPVYDCTVPEVGAFDANGFYVHNCAEQSLEAWETCCLAEIYLPNISSYEELTKVATYLYRVCKHSLRLPCPDSEQTEQVVHRNMRMGIGVTGYLQATEEQRSWLSSCYGFLRKLDNEYSRDRGFPTSIKLTTCKPGGTLSLLGHCTAGVHPGFAQYYIRRIRMSSDSQLVKLCRDHGYHVEYVQGFDGQQDYSTVVVQFPYSLPEGTILAENTTAIEQLEYVKRVQTEWSDNSVSCTIYYRKEELPEIKEWLRKNYNTCVKSVSFLLHSGHGFKQAPLEAITRDEYEKMVARTRPIFKDVEVQPSASDEKYIADSECAGGACPLK